MCPAAMAVATSSGALPTTPLDTATPAGQTPPAAATPPAATPTSGAAAGSSEKICPSTTLWPAHRPASSASPGLGSGNTMSSACTATPASTSFCDKRATVARGQGQGPSCATLRSSMSTTIRRRSVWLLAPSRQARSPSVSSAVLKTPGASSVASQASAAATPSAPTRRRQGRLCQSARILGGVDQRGLGAQRPQSVRPRKRPPAASRVKL